MKKRIHIVSLIVGISVFIASTCFAENENSQIVGCWTDDIFCRFVTFNEDNTYRYEVRTEDSLIGSEEGNYTIKGDKIICDKPKDGFAFTGFDIIQDNSSDSIMLQFSDTEEEYQTYFTPYEPESESEEPLDIEDSIGNSKGGDSIDDVNASTTEEYDFKKFKWGDTQEYVQSIEGTPSEEGDMTNRDAHYISYDTTVAGKDAILVYYFCDEGLFEARYILTEQHSNENLYIDDYNDVMDALKKKYGEPDNEWERWQDDSKQEYYSGKKGDALSYGYLSYYSWWENLYDRTDILVQMTADNYIIDTTVGITSKDISPGEADYSDDF